MITRDDVINKYNEYKKLCSESYSSEFCLYKNFINIPDDYVIDEDKSVKWNREEVQRIKQTYKTSLDYIEEQRHNLYKEYEDLLKKYIQSEYNISDNQYHHMNQFMIEWDEDTYNGTNGVNNKIAYLEDLAQLCGEE